MPVTVYYSVNEAAAADKDGEVKKGGRAEVCYNPAVEIGGSLSATFTVPVITMFFVFYLLVLLSYLTVLRHIERSRRSTKVATSQSLLGKVLRNIVVIQVAISYIILNYLVLSPLKGQYVRRCQNFKTLKKKCEETTVLTLCHRSFCCVFQRCIL